MKLIIVLLFVLAGFSSVIGQTCGFGCLGLSGFYGGYSAQFYDMSTLNEILNERLELENSEINFEKGHGARIGANIFRAKFDKYFLTAKGYYQFLKEESSVTETVNSNSTSFNSKLELNHWGVGVDFGIPVFTIFDWKIVDGGITFYTTKLENTFSINDESIKKSYEQDKISVGYYVGTGLVVHLIRDYISLEGTAVYNKVELGKLVDSDGNYFAPDSDNSIMDKAGVTATIQLNIGVPL